MICAAHSELRLPARHGSGRADQPTAGPAFYYTYSGSTDHATQKNYNSTTSTFYQECNSAQNASPGQDVFTKVVLSATATSTTALITISGSSSTSVSGIVLNGTQQIMSGLAAASGTPATLAGNIVAQINACTSVLAGSCSGTAGHGLTASVSGNNVSITGLADTTTTMTITRGNSGTMVLSPAVTPVANAAKIRTSPTGTATTAPAC